MAWLQAERVYFASRPPESFDLVVPGTDGVAGIGTLQSQVTTREPRG